MTRGMYVRPILFILGVSATGLFFQNCAPGVQVVDLKSTEGSSGELGGSGPVPNAPVYGNAKENPFMCVAGSDPGRGALRRLTQREYSNTLVDLMNGTVALNELTMELGYIPSESVNDVPASRLFDTTNPRTLNLDLMTAYNRIATKVADLVVASPAKMTLLTGSNCVTLATVTDVCLNTFLDQFGLRAARRPLTAAEKTRYITLYRSGLSGPDNLARLLQALLMSPQFLYQLTDNGTNIAGRADLLSLSTYELANRLSYSLIGSMPDAELLTAAGNGSLSTNAGIQQQVDRLMATTKARDNIRSFYSQWLRLSQLDSKTASAAFANGINVDQFEIESKQEIVDFMDHIIWTQSGSFTDVLSSNLIFPKGPNLALVYGVSQSAQAVATSNPNRRGLLTRAGILAQTPAESSSPIKRGVKVRVNLLCDTLLAPTSALLQQAVTPDPLTSTRQQVETKTGAPNCLGCHQQFNPLGYAFENYDSFGRYRTVETVTANGQSVNHTIDAKVIPNINTVNDRAIDGLVDLQDQILLSNKGPACVAKQYLQFSLGRSSEARDNCSLSTMFEALNKTGGSFKEMFRSLSQTASFRQKKLN